MSNSPSKGKALITGASKGNKRKAWNGNAMKTLLLNWSQNLYGYLLGFGRYLLVELILPGGWLIALLL